MIEKGVLIVDGYVDEVMRKARRSILLLIRVKDRLESAADAESKQHPGVQSLEIKNGTIVATLNSDVLDYSELPTLLLENGFQADAVPRRRSQPGNCLYGADQ